VAVTTELRNINDQFSYVLDLPFETAIAGEAPTTDALQMRASAALYDRSGVLIGTNAAAIVAPAANTFSFSSADRAKVERVDLTVAAKPLDSNGDGLPDYWVAQYFGGFANPTNDFDHDGLSNLQEYLAGTDPTDPLSLLEFVNVDYAAGGATVTWTSTVGRYYRIVRSANLLTGFAPLVGGLSATPPLNTYVDATATNQAPFFYRVEVE
jgi:hypothetical protein